MRSLPVFTVLCCFTASGCAQDSALPLQRIPNRIGYLKQTDMPDMVRIVPPAPVTGDARFLADMAIFHSTRSLQGSPRWVLALSDDRVSLAGIFQALRCALGMLLTPESAPKTAALINKANIDAGGAAGILKNLYQHKRPFQVDDAEVCLAPAGRKALESSPDYPSGHTTASWEAGMVLAELLPDLATPVLTRARQFGESRVVCGVHNLSAVEAGWLTANAVFAVQNSSADFRADVDQARSELVALREQAAKPDACAEEAQALATNPY